MSIDFYCVATKSDGYFPVLLESAQKYDINLKVLGMGMQWQGFAWKWKLVYDEIKHMHPEKFIGVIDAYDIVFLKSADYIMNKIYDLNIQDKLIVGQDQLSFSYKLFFGYCENRAINAGTIIGKQKHIISYIKAMCGNHVDCRNSIDDQYELVQYCNKNSNKIYSDHTFDLFVIYLRNNDQVVLNSNAAILHAPMNGNMDHLLKHYGFNFTNLRKSKSWIENTLHWASQPHIILMSIVIILMFVFVLSLTRGLK